MNEKLITITLDLSTVLTVDEFWPDGDAPEEVTKEAVEALIKHCGGPDQILNDWALGPLNCYVRVRGETP